MPKTVILDRQESNELDIQDPSTSNDGGYQSFLVSLQDKLNRHTGELHLTDEDILKIPRYAFDYKQGGWQDRLKRIFGRTLGPDLGRPPKP